MSHHPSHRKLTVHPLHFDVRVVDHQSQRYATAGDYFVDFKGLHFRVSDLGDWRMEGLVLLHELVEYLLVRAAGLEIAEIDAFDMSLEGQDVEPGELVSAPYHRQHLVAEGFERLLCDRLGIDWNEYSDRVDSLVYQRS